MHGPGVGSLFVVKSSPGVNKLVFTRSHDQGRPWHKAAASTRISKNGKVDRVIEITLLFISAASQKYNSLKECQTSSNISEFLKRVFLCSFENVTVFHIFKTKTATASCQLNV